MLNEHSVNRCEQEGELENDKARYCPLILRVFVAAAVKSGTDSPYLVSVANFVFRYKNYLDQGCGPLISQVDDMA
jgi:hypothetical protein